jgi:hypothetical protein
MPEIHPVKRLRLWTVKAAADQGQILVVTCNRCRVTHNYLPADIEKLCGNPSLDSYFRNSDATAAVRKTTCK